MSHSLRSWKCSFTLESIAFAWNFALRHDSNLARTQVQSRQAWQALGWQAGVSVFPNNSLVLHHGHASENSERQLCLSWPMKIKTCSFPGRHLQRQCDQYTQLLDYYAKASHNNPVSCAVLQLSTNKCSTTCCRAALSRYSTEAELSLRNSCLDRGAAISLRVDPA